MINARKLQYYTMAHRLIGYAQGLRENDEYKYGSLADMLDKSAAMLLSVWDEYQLTLPEDQRVKGEV